MGEAGIAGLKAALGLSVSMISSEHFFSAGMSSPWSVAKFAKSPEDKRQVWQLWGEAAGASLAFAVVIGVILGDSMMARMRRMGYTGLYLRKARSSKRK